MTLHTRHWSEWNEAANSAFKRGRFAEAVQLYSGAATMVGSPENSISVPDRAKLFANRSFAYHKVGAAHQCNIGGHCLPL